MCLLASAGFEIYSSDAASPIRPTRPFPFQTPEVHSSALPDNPLTRARSATDPTSQTTAPSHPSHIGRTTPGVQRRLSHSPTLADVRLLPSDLACVGLSDDPGVDHWGLKIVKLVAFPELICSSGFPRSALAATKSPHTEKPSSLLLDLTPAIPLHSSPTSSSSSLLSEDEDDGYFSHSPQAESYSPNLTPASRCHSETFRNSVPPRSKKSNVHKSQNHKRTAPIPRLPLSPDSGVPFLSYTRTSEGSSLTADVYVLSTLFPPSERHMVNSSGELDDADQRLKNGMGHSPDDETLSQMNILSCLQIDLQRFGLGIYSTLLSILHTYLHSLLEDKHGLVNRFSQVLRENGINHMYSSTFKTANILVSTCPFRRITHVAIDLA